MKQIYSLKLKKLIKELNLAPKDLDILEKKEYIPIIHQIMDDGIILEEYNCRVYKKDSLIGLKINDLVIKFLFDTTVDSSGKSMIIPLSLDEGEQFLVNLLSEKTDVISVLNEVFQRANESEKSILLKKIKDTDPKLYEIFSRNYPPMENIRGMLDDIIVKVCEKMNNLELVTVMIQMDVPQRRKILRNVSEKRGQILMDEMHYIGFFTKLERIKSRNKFYKLLQEQINEFSYN